MTLGERIQYERKKLGMSQETLAERLGVSRQAVSKWELNAATPDLDKLMGLAEVFGCTTDALLGRGQDEEPEREGAPQSDPSEGSGGYSYGYGQGTGDQPPRRDGIHELLQIAREKGYYAGYLMLFWGLVEAVGCAVIAAVWSAVTGGMRKAASGMMNGIGGPSGWGAAVEIDGVMVPFDQLDPALQEAIGGAIPGFSGGMDGMMDGFDGVVGAVSTAPVVVLGFLALVGIVVAVIGGVIVWRGKRRGR